jgi:methyl-accepting chemotaxis protein-like sensor
MAWFRNRRTMTHTLEDIVASVKRVTDIIGEIAAASREQSGGVDQVSQAVSQMDQGVQTNAAHTEELSSTADSMAGAAERLRALVARFKLAGNGRAVPPPSIASPTRTSNTAEPALAGPRADSGPVAARPARARKAPAPVAAANHARAGRTALDDPLQDF